MDTWNMDALNFTNVSEAEFFDNPDLNSYLPSYEYGVFWCSLLTLEGLIITVLNSLTIITFLINVHLRKRSSHCIVNLAIADLLIGTLTVPLNAYFVGFIYSFWGDFNAFFTLFYIQNTLHVFTGMASLFALVVISLERVLATVFPLRHRTTSNITYVLGVGVAWLLSAVVAAVWICSFVYLESEVSLYLWMPSLLLALLIICASYIGVYTAVKLHNSQKNCKVQKSFQREKELAVTLFFVAAISLLTWVPFAVVQVINFNNDISLSFNTIYIANAISYANSFVNPIVYVFRMRSFRSALVKLITKCSRDRENGRRFNSSARSGVCDGQLSHRRVASCRGSFNGPSGTLL